MSRLFTVTLGSHRGGRFQFQKTCSIKGYVLWFTRNVVRSDIMFVFGNHFECILCKTGFFTRSLRMATSIRLPVYLPIVLNHVVHVASFKLHYFGFAFQLVSTPDIHSLRNRLLYCSLYFLLLCDILLMTPNHNKTAVHNCCSFLV